VHHYDPFSIWGTGKQVRDFIHIEDVVAATLKAVELDVQGPVNLGLGRPTTFNELAELVCKEVGYTTTYEHKTDAPEGVAYRCSDSSKMLSFYTPKVSLEEGIRRSVLKFR
jgi:nucleoside-diphosphate-sugar epimerase